MEEIRVIKSLSPSVSYAAKSPATSKSSSGPGKGEFSGVTKGKDLSNGELTATAAGVSKPKDNLSEVTAVVEALNQKLEVAHNTLRFHIDDTTEEIKVQVVDKETGKVVRTIPPEPSLSILAQGEFSSLLSVQG